MAGFDVVEFPFLLSAYLLVVALFLAEVALFTLCWACVALGVFSTAVSTGLLGLQTIRFWLRLWGFTFALSVLLYATHSVRVSSAACA